MKKISLALCLLTLIFVSCKKEFKSKKLNEKLSDKITGYFSFEGNNNINLIVKDTFVDNNKKYLLDFKNNELYNKKGIYNFSNNTNKSKYLLRTLGTNLYNYTNGDVISTFDDSDINIFRVDKGVILKDSVSQNTRNIIRIRKKIGKEEGDNNSTLEGWDKPINTGYFMFIGGTIKGKNYFKIIELHKKRDI